MSNQYVIDLSTIDNDPRMKRTRAEWMVERVSLQEKVDECLNRARESTDAEMKEIHKEVSSHHQGIDFIDEVLKRFYCSMCIRCGRLTEVSTYLHTPRNCMPCLKDSVARALMSVGDEA